MPKFNFLFFRFNCYLELFVKVCAQQIRKNKLFPNKNSFDKCSIHYDLKSNTQDYLISMFHISIELEKLNKLRIQNEEKQIRLFNVLPLRTNIVGKNICIDTCALISNFLGDESTSTHLKDYKKENNQYDLWNRFFKLNKRVFKKGQKYTFNSINIKYIRKN